MKSDSRTGSNSQGNISGKNSNNFNNEMNSGTIGAEGSNDNGASTLRVLRKKHAGDTSAGKRKPVL